MDTNETITLEDLDLVDGQQVEVKGGPTMVEYAVQVAQIEHSTTSATVTTGAALQLKVSK